jgi:hypothetical protein
MEVGFTTGQHPAQVRLYHRLLAMQYPDAGRPLGLLVDILPYFRIYRRDSAFGASDS